MLQRSCICLNAGASDFALAVSELPIRPRESKDSDSADNILTLWRRIRVKAAALPGFSRLRPATPLPISAWPVVALSECDECRDLSGRLQRLEEKLDRLLQLGLHASTAPGWYATSEQRLLEAIQVAGESVKHVAEERKVLRNEIADLAEGADKFLAGLRSQLSKPKADLLFELIATVQDGAARRVRSYSEIGRRLGITKQAVQQRYKSLATRHPGMEEYVRAIRRPPKPRNFSEMSPSERRRHGIDENYGHELGS